MILFKTMRLSIILILCTFVIIKGLLEPPQAKYCETRFGFIPVIQTMVVDLDENTNEFLKTCVLKGVNFDNSVVLINGNDTKNEDVPGRYSTNINPNVVILTKQITSAVLKAISVEGVLRSHRSVLFIIITDEENFICQNGVLNRNDFLRLENFMNELWHMYRIAHVGIILPFTCLEKIAIYSGKKYTNQSLYDRTIKTVDLTDVAELQAMFGEKRALLTEDYPLRAGIFGRYPTVLGECDKLHYYYSKVNMTLTGGYCGLDALMMHNIVKHFKFKVDLVTDDKCEGYGHSSATNVTGSLGCIIRKEVDISFNSRFMRKYSRDHVYFLHYVVSDSLCVLVKQTDIVPIWYYSVTLYSSNMWLLIVTVNIIIGLFLWAAAAINNKIKGVRRKSLYFYIRDAFTSMLFGHSNNNNESRLLRGICLCSSLMFVAIYQGHINHVFTALIRYHSIETLDELYRSDINLYVTPSMREIMKQLQKHSGLENKHQRNFIKRMVHVDKYALEMLFEVPNIALVGRKKDIEIDILRNYTENGNQKPRVNIVNECLNIYYLSYITNTAFPFFEELQRFMERISEAGLADAYYTWTCHMLRIPDSMPKLRTETRQFASIKLKNVRLAFFQLLFFQAIAIIVFIVELWRGRRHRRRIKIADGRALPSDGQRQRVDGLFALPGRRSPRWPSEAKRQRV